MIDTKYPSRDAIYAAHTIYRDVMRSFIIDCLKKNGDIPEKTISDALTRDPKEPFILHNEKDATSSLDIDNFIHVISKNWDHCFSSCKEFSSDRDIRNQVGLIGGCRNEWAHPGTEDTNSDVTLSQLLLISIVLDKINAPAEKLEVETIRDRLFSQDIQKLLEVRSNQLETEQAKVTELETRLGIMEERLEVAEAGKTAAEEQLADISDIVSSESFQESSDNRKTVNSVDKQLDSESIKEHVEVPGTLEVGQWVKGIIKNITGFGAFVNIDGIDDIDGLIHKSEMAYERINHPSEVVSINDNVEVKVININPENGKISLSLKQDPWEDIDVKEQYYIDSRVQGTVTSTTDFGVFLKLEEGLIGMIHKSELSWTPNSKGPFDFNQGERINAVVLEVSEEEKRISLGLKQLEPNPWELLKEKFAVGTKITGSVVNVTNFGIFVEIEPGYNGLIRMSAPESLKEGDKVEAIISDIDVEKQQITLYLSKGTNSIRQF